MKLFNEEEGTILIVDDEAQNVQVVGTMLSAFGYDFMVANDGEQALQRVAAKIPDLVLLDIQMPNLNGFEVCKAFQDIEGMQEVPVIFLSANDDKNSIVKALESGGVDYVTKPFNKAELLARVRTHLELKSVRDERSRLLKNTERFLEIMAHDLKNWVGSANFSAKLLAGMEDLPEKAARAAGTIDDSTGHALSFIQDFLASAREAKTEVSLNVQSVELVEYCRKLVHANAHEASAKQITINFQHVEDEVRIETDPAILHRILENLVSNAIKFSPAGSTITLSLVDNPISIAVSDEGPGFSSEDLEKIFTPYTRLSAKPTGGEISTGLGLSIVKQLCDRLSIQIGVSSREEGSGARVELTW